MLHRYSDAKRAAVHAAAMGMGMHMGLGRLPACLSGTSWRASSTLLAVSSPKSSRHCPSVRAATAPLACSNE